MYEMYILKEKMKKNNNNEEKRNSTMMIEIHVSYLYCTLYNHKFSFSIYNKSIEIFKIAEKRV